MGRVNSICTHTRIGSASSVLLPSSSLTLQTLSLHEDYMKPLKEIAKLALEWRRKLSAKKNWQMTLLRYLEKTFGK